MILILDNGLHYSDHSIHFVDCDGMDPDEVVKLYVIGRTRTDQKPHEIARAETLEWREGRLAKPEDVIDAPYDEIGDLSWVSDRGLRILMSECWDDDVRDEIAAEQLKRENA
jgi:hypothetical protein